MRRSLFVVVVASILAASCTGAPTSVAPTPPAPFPPSANTLVITGGVDYLRTGYIAEFGASASMSDGTTQVVTQNTTWTTTDPMIATVDGNGRITAWSHGSITLIASYQGKTATRKVNIVFNFAGTWSGTYTLRACDQTGVFAQSHYCQNLNASSSQPITLTLTQSGAALDEITAAIGVRNLAGTISGSVTSDGRLALGGSFIASTGGVNFRVDIGGWETRPSGITMTGGWAQNLVVVGAAGNAYESCELLTLTHKLEGR